MLFAPCGPSHFRQSQKVLDFYSLLYYTRPRFASDSLYSFPAFLPGPLCVFLRFCRKSAKRPPGTCVRRGPLRKDRKNLRIFGFKICTRFSSCLLPRTEPWFASDSREVRGSYFLLGSSEKCRLVSLTTTPDRATRAIRLGMAMRPLRVSAMAQARSSFMVAPTKMTMMKMI